MDIPTLEVGDDCKVLEYFVQLGKLKCLDFESLKTLRQVSKYLNEKLTKILFEQHFLSLSQLVKPRINQVLFESQNFRNFILKNSDNLSFVNIKTYNINLLHFQKNGIFEDLNSKILGPQLTHLEFGDWANADDYLNAFCEIAGHCSLTNLKFLSIPKLPQTPLTRDVNCEESENEIEDQNEAKNVEKNWNIFIKICGSLEELKILYISKETLNYLLSLGNNIPNSLKCIKILTSIEITGDLLENYLKAHKESKFNLKFYQLRLTFNPTRLPSNQNIREFLQSQSSTLEKLRIVWSLPDPSTTDMGTDEEFHIIEPKENLTLDTWVIPYNLKKLSSLYVETENAPQGWLQSGLVAGLFLPTLQIINDDIKVTDNWFEQVTGHSRPLPESFEVNGIKAKYFFARLQELELHTSEATKMYQEILKLQEEHLGENHLDNLQTKCRLATIAQNDKNPSKALKLAKEIHAGTVKILQLMLGQEKLNGNTLKHEFDSVYCDGCRTEPIIGIWYRCIFCENYDLCPCCYAWICHKHNKSSFWEISMTPGEEETKQYQVKSDIVPWVKGNGQLATAISGLVSGHDSNGTELFVARAHHGVALLPGKLIGSTGPCTIIEDDKEHLVENFEVLTLDPDNVSWIDIKGGKLNRFGTIFGGIDKEGQPAYIGKKVLEDGCVVVGPVYGSYGMGQLYTMTPNGDLEKHDDFQILVLKQALG